MEVEESHNGTSNVNNTEAAIDKAEDAQASVHDSGWYLYFLFERF